MTATTASLTHLDPQTRLLVGSILLFFGRFIKVENDSSVINTPDPVIFIFNHNNYWENLLVVSYLMARRPGKKLAFVSDWMFGRIPFIRWLLNRVDPIYTYTKNARFAVLNRYQQKADGEDVCRACLARLQNRQSLGIFPEGTRNHHPYLLKRGRRGVGEIVLRSQVPVLPVGIDFPQRKQNGRIPSFSPIILKFGQPRTFPEVSAAYQAVTLDDRLTTLERQKLHLFLSATVTHSLMLSLARLCGKKYPFPPPPLSSQVQRYLENFSEKGALL
jgi:1-acyl-sn-glycerol-3-phosphate acyltransferase